MLVTRKINIFSFVFGKPQATNANSASKAQNLNYTIFDELDKRISITRSEDLFKTHALNVINPLSQLNR